MKAGQASLGPAELESFGRQDQAGLGRGGWEATILQPRLRQDSRL